MPQVTGSVSAAGYEVIHTDVIQSFGYGLVVYPPPPLPLNPYYGFTFPTLESFVFGSRLAGQGRKMYRDGVLLFPPYPDQTYQIIAVWSPNAIGKDWSLQY